MNDNRSLYYSTGYYLHRLYLKENPLIKQYSSSESVGNARDIVQGEVELLKIKEDEALASFARSFLGGSGTVNEGLRLLEDFVSGDGRSLLTKIISSFQSTAVGEDNKYIYDSGAQQRIVNETIEALKGMFSNNGESELDGEFNQWKQKLENSLNQVSFTRQGRDGIIRNRSAQTIEGEFFERIVPAYFNMKFKESLQKNADALNKYINLDAEFTGQNRVENAVLRLNKKQPFDVNVEMTYDDMISYLPMQVKTKPKSSKKEINLYTKMNIVNLIRKSLNRSQRKALTTALINQHYWSQGVYRDKVDAVSSKTGIDIKFSGRGHPTAIERLDEASVLEPMKGIVPLMKYAIVYNLVTGINNVTDQLIYLIVGAKGESSVLRSSKIISDIVDDLMRIDISGHGISTNVSRKNKKIIVPNFVDESVYPLYSRVTRRPDWYRESSKYTKNMLNKIAITVTLNYAVQK